MKTSQSHDLQLLLGHDRLSVRCKYGQKQKARPGVLTTRFLFHPYSVLGLILNNHLILISILIHTLLQKYAVIIPHKRFIPRRAVIPTLPRPALFTFTSPDLVHLCAAVLASGPQPRRNDASFILLEDIFAFLAGYNLERNCHSAFSPSFSAGFRHAPDDDDTRPYHFDAFFLFSSDGL